MKKVILSGIVGVMSLVSVSAFASDTTPLEQRSDITVQGVANQQLVEQCASVSNLAGDILSKRHSGVLAVDMMRFLSLEKEHKMAIEAYEFTRWDEPSTNEATFEMVEFQNKWFIDCYKSLLEKEAK